MTERDAKAPVKPEPEPSKPRPLAPRAPVAPSSGANLPPSATRAVAPRAPVQPPALPSSGISPKPPAVAPARPIMATLVGVQATASGLAEAPPPEPRAPPPTPADGSREDVRAAVRAAIDDAIAPLRAQQRETDAHVERIERAVGELREAMRARVEREPRQLASAAAVAQHPELAALADIQADAETHRIVPASIPAPRLRPPPDTATDALARLAREPVDYGAFPGALNGGRRRRKLALIVAFFLVLIVGGLVALAVASQSLHGL